MKGRRERPSSPVSSRSYTRLPYTGEGPGRICVEGECQEVRERVLPSTGPSDDPLPTGGESSGRIHSFGIRQHDPETPIPEWTVSSRLVKLTECTAFRENTGRVRRRV